MMDKVHFKQGDCVEKCCSCKISTLVFINMKHTLRIIIDSPSYLQNLCFLNFYLVRLQPGIHPHPPLPLLSALLIWVTVMYELKSQYHEGTVCCCTMNYYLSNITDVFSAVPSSSVIFFVSSSGSVLQLTESAGQLHRTHSYTPPVSSPCGCLSDQQLPAISPTYIALP
jgi:hypothetical protein